MANGFLMVLISSLFFMACASKEEPVSRAHPATHIGDIFGIDNGMPIREVQKKEFYFKKCELETRRPFPNRIEFECEEK